ncbi:MAG: hypothetical protein QY327_06375 [Fimbriimonadaceae bacterium]|nr:MAG: hypothetical protein QY327_06375 [Fimbriimonadaceae bacterium]
MTAILAFGGLTGCSSDGTSASYEPSVQEVASPEVKTESVPAKAYSDSDLASADRKVKNLLRKGNAMWTLSGEMTDSPKLCFVVLRKDWKLFTKGERAALRPIIAQQITDLKAHPAKYTVCKEGAPIWDYVIDKIGGTIPAVCVSDRKLGRGNFELTSIVDNFDEQQ